MSFENFNFNEFKKDFYGRVTDASLFEQGGTNYMKLVLECLMVKYAAKWNANPYIFKPLPRVYIMLKRFYYKFFRKEIVNKFRIAEKIISAVQPEIILVDNGRKQIDRNDKRISTYFHLIRKFLDEKNTRYFHFNSRTNPESYPDEFSDLAFREFITLRAFKPSEISLIRDLNSVVAQLESKKIFTEDELKHVRIGMTFFFQTFRTWNYYLSVLKPKKLFLLGHYQQEGLILACKKNNVEVIELQHGLIAPEDIFYVMPSIFEHVRDRAMFADRILTYGKYWTDILSKGFEYGSKRTNEIGYYLYEDESGSDREETLLKDFTENKKCVLITTQPGLYKEFIDYIQRWRSELKGQNSNVVFIVKLHPADKEEWFKQLAELPDVIVTRIRLEVLFKYCDIHLTCYSTTIYDALRYGVKNYSVNFPVYSDYVVGIVEQGFSELLSPDSFPVVREKEKANTGFESQDFYRSANLEVLLS
jgi:hypothetical protein